jgi:hypothetical protein
MAVEPRTKSVVDSRREEPRMALYPSGMSMTANTVLMVVIGVYVGDDGEIED